LAARLGVVRSLIGKIERGERRMDVVELHRFCATIGISFVEFAKRLDDEFNQSK
jgi:transcriptional regulator with XRE-family HTH domain